MMPFKAYSALKKEKSPTSKKRKLNVRLRKRFVLNFLMLLEALKKIVKSLALNLVQLYKKCNPSFSLNPDLIPRRNLTAITEQTYNNGSDNKDHELIIHVNDLIGPDNNGESYIVIDSLGSGTFGQVMKCVKSSNKETQVALKVIKNSPAYTKQAVCEIHILNTLLKKGDPDNDNFVRMLTWFTYKDHLCIVFEMLSINLYELLKRNNFSGLTLQTVKLFCKQLLKSLQLLQREKIIHCDLKPENILLRLDLMPVPQIKLIDFGSACFEKNTVYSYIQSRFYRSPEVLLGLPYTGAIDIWSLGCIAAELFLGLPIFPGLSQHRQLMRIFMMLGNASKSMLDLGINTPKFFRREYNGVSLRADDYDWKLKTDAEIAKESGNVAPPFKNYFRFKTLDDIVINSPILSAMNDKELALEKTNRKVFLHFLHGLLKIDPRERWTFDEASTHPFITGEPFKSDWKPYNLVIEKPKPPPVEKSSSGFSSFFTKSTPLASMSSSSSSLNNSKIGKSKSTTTPSSIPQHIVTSSGVHHVNSSSVSFSFSGTSKDASTSSSSILPSIVVDESYFAPPTTSQKIPESSPKYTMPSNSYTTNNNVFPFSPAIGGSGSFPSLLPALAGSAPVVGGISKDMMKKGSNKDMKKQSAIAPSNPRSYVDSKGVAYMQNNVRGSIEKDKLVDTMDYLNLNDEDKGSNEFDDKDEEEEKSKREDVKSKREDSHDVIFDFDSDWK